MKTKMIEQKIAEKQVAENKTEENQALPPLTQPLVLLMAVESGLTIANIFIYSLCSLKLQKNSTRRKVLPAR